MISITKIFTFDAAHQLISTDKEINKSYGKCANIHGHTYKLEVTISCNNGTINKWDGMVLNFNKLKDLVNREIINKVDHKLINEVYPDLIPTAENMVNLFSYIISDKLESEYGMYLILEKVRLYETPDSYVEWRNE